MKRTLILLLSAVLAAAAPALARQGSSDNLPAVAGRSDNPSHPLGRAQAAAKSRAVQARFRAEFRPQRLGERYKEFLARCAINKG